MRAKPESSDKQYTRGAEQMAEVYKAATRTLASAVAAKDSHERNHVKRVEMLCGLMAESLSLDPDTADGIRAASILHDVGKLGVPDHILLKPGPLDQEEFSKTSNHAALGAEIVSEVSFPWPVAEMVRHHHERFDGTGYPDHLAGEAIPLGARIIAVAEVYDSLTSERCYRHGWPRQQAVEHIKRLSGVHFDPVVVRALEAVEPHLAFADSPSKPSAAPDPNGCDSPADLIAQASRELVALFEIAETMSSTLELEEVLELLAHKTMRLTRAAASAVLLLDESCPQQIAVAWAAGRSRELVSSAHVVAGKGVTGKAVAQGKHYLGSFDPNDLWADDDRNPRLKFKSCMVVPIVSVGRVIGALNLYGLSAHTFFEDDVRTLTAVANRAALAIQNARAFDSVRDSAMKDPVTGLHNGRYLQIYLEHEISRAARHTEPLSILCLDLNNFKAVNDSLGHQVGDAVLKDSARVFRSQLRDYDLVTRSGGDEFVVILPGTSRAEALMTADRIRRAMHRYAEGDAALAALEFSASVGAATYPIDADAMDALLEVADAAMYRDKRSRRRGKLAA
jgi:diguanylate cyclase (GGDEF)-like protein/putative nucleotidyltransferase with HDIG domain